MSQLRRDVQFSLWHNRAEFKELKVTSENSSLQVNGTVTDFERPQVQLSYGSSINAAQLGAVIRDYQLRGGTMLLDGTATYSEAAGYASRGRIALRDIDYVDDGVVLRKANLNSNFALDNNQLALTRMAARLLGGQINGDADIKNLLPPTPVPNTTAPAGQLLTTGKPGSARTSSQPRRTSAVR